MTMTTTTAARTTLPQPELSAPHLPVSSDRADDVTGHIVPVLLLGGALFLAACTVENNGNKGNDNGNGNGNNNGNRN